MSDISAKEYKDAFPAVLRLKRTSLKITQEELADRAGTATRYIGHLEQGARQPSLSVFCALALALECSPSQFMAELEKRVK